MKQITIRGLPADLEKAVLAESRKKGLSLNRTIIALLEQCVGSGRTKKQLHHDLDRLSGAWSESEARAFDKSLQEQRKVDKELWR